MQVSVTDIQLIAVYGMTDVVAEVYPKALISRGNEIIQMGRRIAYEGNYSLMRGKIAEYMRPKIEDLSRDGAQVCINVGYQEKQGWVTMNLRSGDAVRYFHITDRGRIEEGV